jgi:hypothetical protein
MQPALIFRCWEIVARSQRPNQVLGLRANLDQLEQLSLSTAAQPLHPLNVGPLNVATAPFDSGRRIIQGDTWIGGNPISNASGNASS